MYPSRSVLAVLVAVAVPLAVLPSSREAAKAPARVAASAGRLTAELSGKWAFEVDLGSRAASGEFWLWRRGNDYTGTLTVRGTNTLPIRTLTHSGTQVQLTVDSPDGSVVFDGTLDDAGTELRGIVTYHAGERFPMKARRLPKETAVMPGGPGSDRLESPPQLLLRPAGEEEVVGDQVLRYRERARFPVDRSIEETLRVVADELPEAGLLLPDRFLHARRLRRGDLRVARRIEAHDEIGPLLLGADVVRRVELPLL